MLKEFTLFAFLASVALGDTNCMISILNEKYNGEKIRMTFHSRLNSKTECEALAKMHKPNVLTREVRRKHVTFRWEGANPLAGRPPKSSRKKY